MKNIKFTTDSTKVSKEIESAKSLPNASGMVKVVWGNKDKANSRNVHYGWNFQPVGSVEVGDVRENAWSGSEDQAYGNVCKVLAIV